MRRLLAWLRRRLAPAVPVRRAPPRAPDDTPPPARRLALRRCRRCARLIVPGEPHDCAAPGPEEFGGEG